LGIGNSSSGSTLFSVEAAAVSSGAEAVTEAAVSLQLGLLMGSVTGNLEAAGISCNCCKIDQYALLQLLACTSGASDVHLNA
jgi:hypothetical protein